MDAEMGNQIRINIIVLESGAKLIWEGDNLPYDFFTNNDSNMFQNIIKRIEEMERNGKISFQK